MMEYYTKFTRQASQDAFCPYFVGTSEARYPSKLLKGLEDAIDFVHGLLFLSCVFADGTIKFWFRRKLSGVTSYLQTDGFSNDCICRSDNISKIVGDPTSLGIRHDVASLYYVNNAEIIIVSEQGSAYLFEYCISRCEILYDAEIVGDKACKILHRGKDLNIIVSQNGKVYFTGNRDWNDMSDDVFISDKNIDKYTVIDGMENVIDVLFHEEKLFIINGDGELYVSGVITPSCKIFGDTNDYKRVNNKQVLNHDIGLVISMYQEYNAPKFLNSEGSVWTIRDHVGWVKIGQELPKIKYLPNTVMEVSRLMRVKSARKG